MKVFWDWIVLVLRGFFVVLIIMKLIFIYWISVDRYLFVRLMRIYICNYLLSFILLIMDSYLIIS